MTVISLLMYVHYYRITVSGARINFIYLLCMNLHRGVNNAAKLRTRLCNLYNFTKITPGLHWDYNKFAPGLHIFVIQELAPLS